MRIILATILYVFYNLVEVISHYMNVSSDLIALKMNLPMREYFRCEEKCEKNR